MTSVDLAADNLNGMTDHLVGIRRAPVQAQFAASNASEIEHVVDHARFQLDVAADHFQSVLQIGTQIRFLDGSAGPE